MELQWGNKLKDGDYMSRICIAANEIELTISADSLFTNSITHETSEDNQKVFYNQSEIVAVLGTSELFVAKGTIHIGKILQDFLKETSVHGLEALHALQEKMGLLCDIYKFTKPCLIMFLWREKDKFYMYFFDVHYQFVSHSFGIEKGVEIQSPLVPVTPENKQNYIIDNLVIEAGDGLETNPTINRISYRNTLDSSVAKVKEAILNKNTPTVGGPIYSITMDKEGNIETYINGIEKYF